MKSLEELRVVDLRNELEKRGLDKTGIKAVLLERLKKAVLAEGENPDDIEVNIPSKNNGSRRSIEENHEMGDKNCNGANESLSDDPLKDPGETFDLQDSDEILLSNEEDAFKGDMQDSGSKKLIPVDGKESDVFTAMVEKPELSQLLDDLQHKEIKPETDPCQKKVVMKKDELAAPTESSTAEPLIEEEEEFLEDEGESRITREDYVQRMEDDSINLLLEDDDKMLDYEENDRNDMDDCPSSECKEKNEDSNVDSVDKSSKEDEVETEANKLELQKKTDDSEKSCSSKNEDSTIEKADHEKADKKQTSSSSASVSKNLWVSGLASNTRAQDLKLLFCKHGKVLSAKIVTNARTPGARCYGFVTLASVQDAARCITYLNRTELHGRMIQVEKAKGEPGGPIKISTLPTNLPTVTGKDSNEVDKKEDRAVSSIRDSDKLRIRTSKEREESLDRRKKSLSIDRKERIRDGQDRTKPLHFDQMRTRTRRPSRRSLLSRDERCRLSAKERVVDRRHEVRGNKRSPPTKRDVLSLSRIVEERERHRASTRGRLEREQEKRRRIEELELKNIEKRQKEEAERLRRERDKLRLEREKIEIQKQELLRLEREQQKLERERLERERDELRKQQLKYEQVRRGSKRPISDRREFFDDRKRGSSRNSERSPDLGSIRGIPRMSDKNLPQLPSRNLDQGLTRGSDRVTASRGLDRTTERSHYNDNNHRESHYPNSNSSDRGARPSMRGARGSSHYEERRDRDREDRRPMESSVPRNKDSRDHRSSPSICRPVRDSHYNTSSLPGSSMMDAWHSGNAQHPPKNAPYSSGSNLMSVIAGTHIGNRGMEGTGSWKTSNVISTNERWGGNPGNRANANLIDQYRMGGQVPMNNIPVMSNVMPSDRFGGMGSFRK